MSTPTSDLDAIADELMRLRATRARTPSLLASHPTLTIDAAYAVAERIAQRRVAGGERIVGRKIGLTNPAGWAAVDARAPIWGFVYDHTLLDAADGQAAIDLSSLIAPRLEPEIGFGLREPLTPGVRDPARLLASIEWIAPCFEVIDSHIGEWTFKAVEAIADFGVHARLIVGPRTPVSQWPADALIELLKSCPVELHRDDQVIARGSSAATLGSPLQALAGLCEVLAGLPEATSLQAGDVITTGTLTTPQDIGAGQRWAMQVAELDLPTLTLAT